MKFVTTRLTVDVENRGRGIPKELRDIASPLISQAFALQRNFEIADDSACMLSEMLRDDPDSAAVAVDRTWEGTAFVYLRRQLFRALILDLYACVLDKARGNGSLAAILQRLRTNRKAIPALRAFYSDRGAIVAKVSGLSDPVEITRRERAEVESAAESNTRVFDSQWKDIQASEHLLTSVEALRLSWSRSKAIAHFERTQNGLVVLDDPPPYGTGPLRWREPLEFLDAVRPLAYNVFSLVTATSWRDGGVPKMYARAFWDRFKNGKTDVAPGTFKPFEPQDS
jgi:hypothetical protein